MAKSKSFFGLRKGSTKTMTFSVLRGQQITKDRVTDITNPRTMDQTLQRIPFAQAVKFYKQATRGIFRFAFEDKRPLESDYNAFMRHNVKYAGSVSLDNFKNNMYPSMGNYMLSAGSLPPAEVFVSLNAGSSYVFLSLNDIEDGATTVGEASVAILERYPNLAEGDIITFVGFKTQVKSTGLLAEQILPEMEVHQLIIDTTSETTLAGLGFDDIPEEGAGLGFKLQANTLASAGAVIFSRTTPDGLKVSDSNLVGNSVWISVLENRLSIQVREGDAYSWGAAEKAILQGSLSD